MKYIRKSTDMFLETLYKICLPIFVAAFTVVSCAEDEDPRFVPDTVEDTMKVHASDSIVVLSSEKANQEAVFFSWNTAQQRKYNSEIVYYIQFFEDGLETSHSELIKINEDATSYSLTNEELNTMVRSWGMNANVRCGVLVKVLAQPVNDTKFLMPEVSSCTIQVTTY